MAVRACYLVLNNFVKTGVSFYLEAPAIPPCPVMRIFSQYFFSVFLFSDRLSSPVWDWNARSVQKKESGCNKTGICLYTSPFIATHLPGRGTDSSMIQNLVGHNDLKTTLRYLHTSHKDLIRIISPIENPGIELPKPLPPGKLPKQQYPFRQSMETVDYLNFHPIVEISLKR